MLILKGSFLSLLNTHLAKAFLLLISFWEEAEVVLKLLLKPKRESEGQKRKIHHSYSASTKSYF